MEDNDKVMPTFQESHNSAMQWLLLNLICELHEKNAIDARSLISKIESGSAFGQAAYQKAPNPVLAGLLQVLGGLLDAGEQARSGG